MSSHICSSKCIIYGLLNRPETIEASTLLIGNVETTEAICWQQDVIPTLSGLAFTIIDSRYDNVDHILMQDLSIALLGELVVWEYNRLDEVDIAMIAHCFYLNAKVGRLEKIYRLFGLVVMLLD